MNTGTQAAREAGNMVDLDSNPTKLIEVGSWVPVRVKKTRQNLKPFAGVGVTYRHREEAQTEGQHDDVQHELLLVALVSVRKFSTFPRRWVGVRSRVVTCHVAHIFSR
jgi:hypothetical protein